GDGAADGPASVGRCCRRASRARPARAEWAAPPARRSARGSAPRRSRCLGTNFGRITSTTTAEAWRRSSTSLTSAPITVELIEPLALHVERDELDLDARQVVGHRLSPGRRAPGVCADRLRCRRRWSVRPEQGAEEPEGELAVVRREPLSLLAAEAVL